MLDHIRRMIGLIFSRWGGSHIGYGKPLEFKSVYKHHQTLIAQHSKRKIKI